MNEQRYDLLENPTVFGKILRGEIPAEVVYEDDHVLAFNDISPQAPVHVVLIPKQHMTCLRCAEAGDADLLAHMLLTVNVIADKLGLKEGGYRLITNAGEDGGQEVPHLHFHILGGGKVGALVGA